MLSNQPAITGLALALGLTLLGGGLLTACGGGDGDHRRLSQIVTANKSDIVRVALEDNDGVVHAKGTLQLRLFGYNSDNEAIEITDKASWQLSDPQLGNITRDGLFTPAAENGDLTITARFANLEATQGISISNAELVGVTITHPHNRVNVCDDTRFTGRALLANGLEVDYPLQWRFANSESNNLAAFADSNQPLLHTYKSGVIRVVAEAKNNAGETIASAPLELVIVDTLVSLDITSSRGNTANGVVLNEGQVTTLKVNATWEDNSSAEVTTNARLSLDNAEAASLNAQTHELRAIAGSYQGTSVTLNAECDTRVATLPVSIIKADVSRIEIRAGNGSDEFPTVTAGSSLSLTLTATLEDDAGTDENYTHNVEWSINTDQSGAFDPALISITEAGVLQTSSNLTLTGQLNLVIDARVLDENGNTKRNRAGEELRDDLRVSVQPRL